MDLSHFSFAADVWGTVSDWLMIIVTSVTAFFLYKTLQSQKDVQKAQNRLLQIEQIRLKEQFKPELKYSRFLEHHHIEKPEQQMICIAVRNISLNAAFKVKPIYTNDKLVTPIIFKPNPHTLLQGEKHASLYFLIKSQNDSPLDCMIRFSIEYEDVAGTKYSQAVFFDAYAGFEEFKTFDPKIIRDNDL